MPTFQTDETEFYYEVYGEDKNPPLVLIPGLTLDSTYWQLMVPLLKNEFKVVIFDPRDMGKTKVPPADYRIPDMARDVADLMDRLSLSQYHVVGFSMGSLIAQSLALQFPSRVTSLVAAGMGIGSSRRTENVLRTWLELYTKLPLQLMIKEQLLWLHGDAFFAKEGALEAKSALLAALPNPPTIEQFTRQVKACLSWTILREKDRPTAPCLVLIGAEDRMVSVEEARLLALELKNAPFHIVQDAGHQLFWEKPQECADLIRSFCLQGVVQGV